MDKERYLARLRAALRGLPEADIAESLAYYTELIEDRMEEGMSEAAAVAQLPAPEAAAEEILLSQPMERIEAARVKTRRKLGAWEIILLVLGSPVWLPLLLSFALLVLTVYLLVWVAALVLWTVDLSAAVGAVGGLAGMLGGILQRNLSMELFAAGAALAGAGLAILLFFASLWTTKASARLGRALLRSLKASIIGKEKAA
jgi:uncharacterized membrane protein